MERCRLSPRGISSLAPHSARIRKRPLVTRRPQSESPRTFLILNLNLTHNLNPPPRFTAPQIRLQDHPLPIGDGSRIGEEGRIKIKIKIRIRIGMRAGDTTWPTAPRALPSAGCGRPLQAPRVPWQIKHRALHDACRPRPLWYPPRIPEHRTNPVAVVAPVTVSAVTTLPVGVPRPMSSGATASFSTARS